ncbi:MAG TPA: class I lanthipeptide [Thermoanaerobaculia bacterium]|nr:class I lanthipeptide [Thermoanaerobaculia bacterium]
MKKKGLQKLELNRETLRTLSARELPGVGGGVRSTGTTSGEPTFNTDFSECVCTNNQTCTSLAC